MVGFNLRSHCSVCTAGGHSPYETGINKKKYGVSVILLLVINFIQRIVYLSMWDSIKYGRVLFNGWVDY